MSTPLRKPVGILGGTFDPVHLGHLRICVELRELLGLDHVRLIPNRVPPHRDAPRASDETRADWIARAIADEPGLQLDRRELDRDGASYTAETLAGLRDELDDTPIVCILGQDAFDGLVTWHRWDEIPNFAHIVVVPRPGTSAGRLDTLPGARITQSIDDLHQTPAGCLYAAQVTPLAISSTQVRRLLVQGRSIRYLVPNVVWQGLADKQEVYDSERTD